MNLFNFTIKRKVKKATTDLFSFSNNTPPENWGGSYFYPIRYTTQNNFALIKMYNELPEVQAPINLIIDALSIIPFKHYTIKKDIKIEVENSPYMSILNNPNQFQTKCDFIKYFFLNRILLGAGYINFVKSFNLESSQLYVLPTENTTPIIDKTVPDLRVNDVKGYKTGFDGTKFRLDKKDVFVNKETTIGQNSMYEPRSRLMSAILTSDSLRNNYDARIKLLADSGARAIITPQNDDTTLTPQQAKAMQNKFTETFGVVSNKAPVMVGSIPVEVKTVGLNANELELLPNKDKDLQILCNVLGLDPSLFGIGQTTYNNKKMAKQAFYEDVIEPYFNNFLDFMQTIFAMPETEILQADYTQITAIQEDFQNTVDAASTAYNDNVIFESEYRETLGLEGGEDKKKIQIDYELQQTASTGQSEN